MFVPVSRSCSDYRPFSPMSANGQTYRIFNGQKVVYVPASHVTQSPPVHQRPFNISIFEVTVSIVNSQKWNPEYFRVNNKYKRRAINCLRTSCATWAGRFYKLPKTVTSEKSKRAHSKWSLTFTSLVQFTSHHKCLDKAILKYWKWFSIFANICCWENGA